MVDYLAFEIVNIRAQDLCNDKAKERVVRKFWAAMIPLIFSPTVFGVSSEDAPQEKGENSALRTDFLIERVQDHKAIKIMIFEFKRPSHAADPRLWQDCQEQLQKYMKSALKGNLPFTDICYGAMALGRKARFFQQHPDDEEMKDLDFVEKLDILDVIDDHHMVSKVLSFIAAKTLSPTPVEQQSTMDQDGGAEPGPARKRARA